MGITELELIKTLMEGDKKNLALFEQIRGILSSQQSQIDVLCKRLELLERGVVINRVKPYVEDRSGAV